MDVEVPGALAALVGSQTAGAIARVAPEGWITLSHDDIADRGFVRVYFDDHLIPRRDVRDELSYAFELAQIRPEVSMFPRKIGGQYVMVSRLDGESLYLMRSDNPHIWNNATLLQKPVSAWESVKIGNCGSPLETDRGWLSP